MFYNDQYSSGQILIMYLMFIVLDTVEVSDRFARSDTKFRTLINVLRFWLKSIVVHTHKFRVQLIRKLYKQSYSIQLSG